MDVGPVKFTSISQATVVLVVGFLAIALPAGYLIKNSDGLTPASADSDSRVDVSNVYNLPVSRGLPIIEQDGFSKVRTARVCSNSVAADRIREVILDNGAADVSDETSIVNQGGAVIARIEPDTPLLVKVSNGLPC